MSMMTKIRSISILVSLFIGLMALPSINFVHDAFAVSAGTQAQNNYTINDPAVKYHCFETYDNGTYKIEAGHLVPCPIDSGDNAWMMASAALVLMMTPAGLA